MLTFHVSSKELIVALAGRCPVVYLLASAQGGFLAIGYPQSKAAGDWTMTAEISSDMVNWYSGPGFTTQTSVTSLDALRNLITITDDTPISANSKRFMRLKVTLP